MTRYLVNWPVLLLPLVALGTVGLLGVPVPQILVILAVLLALVAPAEGAKIAHFALFAYGAYGLFKLHSLQIYESQGVRYGLVTASRGMIAIPGGYQLTAQMSGFGPMLAEAVGFMALGVCVLGVTAAPGGRAVRRAVAQLRGGDGQPKTVPPLLLIPVIFLGEELFSEHLLEAGLALVAEARETSSRALDDLRDLVRGIYPPVLADRGLADAVRALALDAPVTVDTDITLPGEPPMPVAAAVYFAIAEALTNAVRHSGSGTVQIGIGHADGVLRATVTDTGQGGADPSVGTGLSGVERRLATFDGSLAVTSPSGGPTIVVIEFPCALAVTADRAPA